MRRQAIVAVIGMTAALAGSALVGSSGSVTAAPTNVANATGAARRTVAIMAGSVASFARPALAIDAPPAAERLTIQLWLQPKAAAATREANAVSTPGNPLFHHYLSPNAWTARFGASAAAVSTVEAWLRAEGFTGVSVDAQRAYVRATAAISTINRAFDVQMMRYKSTSIATAGQQPVLSNDRPIMLPTSLVRIVSGVTGLDNAMPTERVSRPRFHALHASRSAASYPRCSEYYGQHVTKGLPRHFGTTSFPSSVCGYSAKQLRAAYGANLTNTGKGQTIALVVLGLGPQMLATLQHYAKVNRLPGPSHKRFHQLSLRGKKNCGALFDDGEEQLDIEASYAMAPGASQLVVGANSCKTGDEGLQGLIDADQVVVNGNGHHPLASIVSNSWEGRFPQPAATTKIEHAYLLKAAAEGVGMYFASGDDPGISIPQADPYATSVGGTTLGIGKHRNRLFETGWASGSLELRNGKWRNAGELGGAGGGSIALWKQPAYQRGIVPAALARYPGKGAGPYRTEPDISADADPATGMSVVMLNPAKGASPKFVTAPGSGTSQATPTIAGIVAAAQQGQSEPFGFINPLIYQLAGTDAFHDILPFTSSTPTLFRAALCNPDTCQATGLETFDLQDHSAPYSGQVTLKGYDNITGLGTPAGQHFITALRALGR
jgi:subtilase family serine protease